MVNLNLEEVYLRVCSTVASRRGNFVTKYSACSVRIFYFRRTVHELKYALLYYTKNYLSLKIKSANHHFGVTYRLYEITFTKIKM